MLLTARGRLRRLRESDLKYIVELESNPEVMRYTPHHGPLSAEKSRARLNTWLANQPGLEPLGTWAAELKNGTDFLAWFMILPQEKGFPELGFMLPQRVWEQGLATEFAARLIQHAFLDLKLEGLSATVEPGNLASKAVLAKLGFVPCAGDEPNLEHFELRSGFLD